jgi:hypothetical protein
VSVVIAPISMPSLVGRTPRSSSIPLRSTTTFGLLDAVLQPVEAIEASGHHPSVGCRVVEQLLSVVNGTRLKQIESRHDVSYYSHGSLLLHLVRSNVLPSGDLHWAGLLRAT